MNNKKIDPILLEIAWNGLKSIADECFITLMRCAFSTNIKERHDHSTAIIDKNGNLIAQAEHALPIHLASMSGLIEHLLKSYKKDINQGDIFISNDPHVAGGTHLPDINMAMPIFIEGKLVAFIANIVHHADVGGAAAGSMSGGLDEIYKEGIRIPITRLYKNNILNKDILNILLLNMRLRNERQGDLNAQIAACKLGVTRIKDMIKIYGKKTIEQIFNEILNLTKERMIKAIAKLPNGIFKFEDFMDDDGLGNKDIKINLIIKKFRKKIEFDFSKSSPQTPGNFNLSFNATQSAVFYSLKALLDPGIPNNSGIFDAIKITVPEGSFLNCVEPASVALRANTCQRVVDVVFGALAKVLPEHVTGAANGANTSAVFSGINPVNGERYVYLETLGGGMGGRHNKDGKDGVQVNITNTSNLPVEAIEMEYPLRVEEYSLVEDSGGAGKNRGGMGIRRIIRPINHTCEFSGVGERFKHAPWGIFGGKPGLPGCFYLSKGKFSKIKLPSKATGINISPSSCVIMETPGAGGYGSPLKRTKKNLTKDKKSGKFSKKFLRKFYKF